MVGVAHSLLEGSKQAENKPSTKLMETLTIIFHRILFILNEVSKIRLNDDGIMLLYYCCVHYSLNKTMRRREKNNQDA